MGVQFALPPSPPAIVEKAAVAKHTATPVVVKGTWGELNAPTAAPDLVGKELKENAFLAALQSDLKKTRSGDVHERHAGSREARQRLAELLKDPANDELFLKGAKIVAESLKSKNTMEAYHGTVILMNLRGDLFSHKRNGKALFPDPKLSNISEKFSESIAFDALSAFRSARSITSVSDLLPVVSGLGARAREVADVMLARLDHFSKRPFGVKEFAATSLCEDLIRTLDSVGSLEAVPMLTKIASQDRNPELREVALVATTSIKRKNLYTAQVSR